MGTEHLVFDAAYYTGAGYGGYSDARVDVGGRWDGIGTTVAQRFIDRGFSLAGRNLLIVGCGIGQSVARYRNQHGVNAWGLDSSPAAHALALPEAAPFMRLGDATVAADLDAIAADAGVSPRWDCILSELLIVCWDDPRILAAVDLWHARATQRPPLGWSGVLHQVHTHQVSEPNPALGGQVDSPYRTRTLAEWRTFLDQLAIGGQRPDWVWRWVDGAEG